MKLLIITITFSFLCIGSFAQSDSAYNKELADSLGADDYGMKTYSFVILKSGTNKTTDKAFVDSMFRGHMNNIGRLAKQGLLIVAGPMQKNEKTYRGIFILNIKTKAEAEKLLETDPAISSKLLEAEIYQWYGSAALPIYLPYHDKVSKKKF